MNVQTFILFIVLTYASGQDREVSAYDLVIANLLISTHFLS